MGNVVKHQIAFERVMSFTSNGLAFTAYDITKSLRDDGVQIDHAGMVREIVHAVMTPFLSKGLYGMRDRKFGGFNAVYYEPKGGGKGARLTVEETESAMNDVEVISSVIKSIGYDPDTEDMKVSLNSGTVYTYKKVPADVFLRFLFADSKGSFYNQHVKGKY